MSRSVAKQMMLRDLFKAMDQHKAQDIRDAYYKAVEGIRSLVELLEIADVETGDSPTMLLKEHLLACEAMDAIYRSQLGKVL